MTACAVALILAIDVSGGVSAEHYRMQRDSTADALTNVAGALRAAVDLHASAPCTAERRIVDISGDGRHQGDAAEMAEAVAEALATGTEVNALPITTDTEPDIADWYREHVTSPAGGFVVPATPESFGRALRLKLSLELASRF